MTGLSQKVRYLEAYIHYRKNLSIKINLPKSERELYLTNHCFTMAKNYMNSIGKNLRV